MKKDSQSIKLNIDSTTPTTTINNNIPLIEELNNYGFMITHPALTDFNKGIIEASTEKIENDMKITKQNSEIEIIVNDFLKDSIELKFTIRQTKITKYVGMKWAENNYNDQIKIKFTELFDFLGMSAQTKNKKEIINDLKVINKLVGTFKIGKKDYIGNFLHFSAIEKNLQEIIITLGAWTLGLSENPSEKKLMFIDKREYSKGDIYSTLYHLISEKFRIEHKKKNKIKEATGFFEVRISTRTMIDALGWKEKSIKINPKRYETLLLKELNLLQINEKFEYEAFEKLGKTKGEIFLNTVFRFIPLDKNITANL